MSEFLMIWFGAFGLVLIFVLLHFRETLAEFKSELQRAKGFELDAQFLELELIWVRALLERTIILY